MELLTAIQPILGYALPVLGTLIVTALHVNGTNMPILSALLNLFGIKATPAAPVVVAPVNPTTPSGSVTVGQVVDSLIGAATSSKGLLAAALTAIASPAVGGKLASIIGAFQSLVQGLHPTTTAAATTPPAAK
jgi:hypothetical protein